MNIHSQNKIMYCYSNGLLLTRKHFLNTKRPQMPRFEGGLNILYMLVFWSHNFWGNWPKNNQKAKLAFYGISRFRPFSSGKTAKRHIFTPGPFICDQTFQPIQAHILEIIVNRHFGRIRHRKLAETVKLHIYTSRPFIWPSVPKF